MRSGHVPVWRKRGVALTYILLQLYHEVLRLHGHVLHTFQMRLAHVSDTFERYVGAELYCNCQVDFWLAHLTLQWYNMTLTVKPTTLS